MFYFGFFRTLRPRKIQTFFSPIVVLYKLIQLIAFRYNIDFGIHRLKALASFIARITFHSVRIL